MYVHGGQKGKVDDGVEMTGSSLYKKENATELGI